MDELTSCPFCGSGWLYETRRNGYCDETPTMFCNSCKAVVTWEQVEEEGVNDETRTFVREHWNTRAQTVFGMTLDEVRQMMKRDAERERTCRNVDDEFPFFKCSECGCNAVVGYGSSGDGLPNYCPNCGAKVIGDAE